MLFLEANSGGNSAQAGYKNSSRAVMALVLCNVLFPNLVLGRNVIEVVGSAPKKDIAQSTNKHKMAAQNALFCKSSAFVTTYCALWIVLSKHGHRGLRVMHFVALVSSTSTALSPSETVQARSVPVYTNIANATHKCAQLIVW
jgi:hypothetical protein